MCCDVFICCGRPLLGMLDAKDVNLRRGKTFRANPLSDELSLLPDGVSTLQRQAAEGGIGGRRHQLLKLRVKNPDAFKVSVYYLIRLPLARLSHCAQETIPLREEDVRRSTHLSELLHHLTAKSVTGPLEDAPVLAEDLYLTEAATAILKSRYLKQKVRVHGVQHV